MKSLCRFYSQLANRKYIHYLYFRWKIVYLALASAAQKYRQIICVDDFQKT